MKAFLRAVLVIVVIAAAVAAVAAFSIARRGLSTRVKPTRTEEIVARTMRRFATPSDLRRTPNPVEPTQSVLEEGLEHFADHYAM